MTDIFDVVADPTRRALLERLLAAKTAEGEASVGSLVEATGLTQPTVSKHLKVLRDAGLVSVREEAQHRFYSIAAEPLGELADWTGRFLGSAPEIHDDVVPIIAWSGAELGETLGRAAATTAHQAQTVLERLERARDRAVGYLEDARTELQGLIKH